MTLEANIFWVMRRIITTMKDYKKGFFLRMSRRKPPNNLTLRKPEKNRAREQDHQLPQGLIFYIKLLFQAP